MIYKKCSKCSEVIPLDFFYKDKKSKDGFGYYCKNCSNLLRKKNYLLKHDAELEYRRNYYCTHKSQMFERNILWKSKHKLDVRGYEKKYYENNKGKIQIGIRNARRKNMQKYRNSLNEWRNKNPSKVQSYRHNRRSRELNRGEINENAWNCLLEIFGHVCLSCGKSDVKLTLDHVVPLSKNGLNVVDNIQPLCGRCNSSKGTKTLDYRYNYA